MNSFRWWRPNDRLRKLRKTSKTFSIWRPQQQTETDWWDDNSQNPTQFSRDVSFLFRIDFSTPGRTGKLVLASEIVRHLFISVVVDLSFEKIGCYTFEKCREFRVLLYRQEIVHQWRHWILVLDSEDIVDPTNKRKTTSAGHQIPKNVPGNARFQRSIRVVILPKAICFGQSTLRPGTKLSKVSKVLWFEY